MLYYLFQYLEFNYNLPGAGVFEYISFRASLAVITSLLVSMVFGGRIIRWIRSKQIGEEVRNLGLSGEESKRGTPTMGGLIILSAILIPTILFTKITNIYIIIMIISTIWLGLIGFIDDYIKVYKKDKSGLAGRFKILGQIGIGLIVSLIMIFHSDIVIRENAKGNNIEISKNLEERQINTSQNPQFKNPEKSVKTTIPFFKNNSFDYRVLTNWMGKYSDLFSYFLFIFILIFIVTAVSNGANMTDGLDGLATGTSAIIGAVLALFAYVSDNTEFASYLNIMLIPGASELAVYLAAFVGACVGFLWYNSYPAQVFMGDTGSLSIGGIIAIAAILIRKELLIPILCGGFLVESLSVMIQVGYFKYTKKKYGAGKRIFKMAPIHHHFQKLGIHESKIVTRFWIAGIILAVLTIVTLKLR